MMQVLGGIGGVQQLGGVQFAVSSASDLVPKMTPLHRSTQSMLATAAKVQGADEQIVKRKPHQQQQQQDKALEFYGPVTYQYFDS